MIARSVPDGPPPAMEVAGSPRAIAALPDRERLSNDLMNTGVTAALVGGFALSNLQMGFHDIDSAFSIVIYGLAYFAVHATTCAALSSALIYRVVNQMEDDSIETWAERNTTLLRLPIMKFGMGCVSYIASVLCLAYFDLEGALAAQILCLVIGGGSMTSVFLIQFALTRDAPIAPGSRARRARVDIIG